MGTISTRLTDKRIIISRWSALVVLLILGTAPVVSCTWQESRRQASARYIDQVNALVNAPMKEFGKGRNAIQAKLGVPSSITTKQFANRHDPKQIDLIHTLSYRGLVIWIYDVVAFKKEMIASVRMTENRPGLLPELIGKNERAIKAMFGVPHRKTGTVFEYTPIYDDEPGDDVVMIEFRNSIVEAVEWDFYLD